MGGFGSGRAYRRGKNTTTDLRPLDIRMLKRKKLLIQGSKFSWYWSRNRQNEASITISVEVNRIILNYRCIGNTGEGEQKNYPVYLDWTKCNAGGQRVWFKCPASECGKRVAVLYGGTIFACRNCHKLVYACQSETYDQRAMRRADKIRLRLGWVTGIANPTGDKPKGMHWRTYELLLAKHDAFANMSWLGTAKRLALMKV